MNSFIGRTILIGVMALFAFFAWQYYGKSGTPSASNGATAPAAEKATPRPAPSSTVEAETETKPTPEPTPDAEAVAIEPQVGVPTTCRDGSALTVTARDENQISYKCASGSIGATFATKGGNQTQ